MGWRAGVVAEQDLGVLLRDMRPELRPGEYVFVTAEHDADPRPALASVREDEGLSMVLTRAAADGQGLAYDYVAAWITLRVCSALQAVGLTACVSHRLAQAGISCNVVAGYHHDHLLVPAERALEALSALRALADDK